MPEQKENEAMSHPYAPVCRHLTGQYKYLAFMCVFVKAAFKGYACHVTLGSPALGIQFAVTELIVGIEKKKITLSNL